MNLDMLGTAIHKIFETNLFFMGSSALREKFSFCFFKSFLLAVAKFSIWQGDWALGYHSMGFRHFPDIS